MAPGTEPGECIGMWRDVTVARGTQEALERTQFAMDHAAEMIFWIRREGRFVYANQAGCSVLGYSPAEMQALHVWDVNPSLGPERWPGCWAEARAAGSLVKEVQYRRRDGSSVPVEITVNHVDFGGEEYHFAFTRDISARIALAEQLRQSQKIEAVGQLAGGIAHDFNNILGVVLGYTEMLLRAPEMSERSLQRLTQVQQAGQRAASLTRQLLAFSRKQVLEPKVIDLSDLLEDLRRMLERLIGEDVTLSVRTEPDLGQIRADPGQLEQVVINLAVNARDAMPTGGRLTLWTQNIRATGRDESRPGLVAGEYVTLTVTDTGSGMDAEVQRHIFEPFFTTKAVASGTGLGLATVYGIVKQSGGYVYVQSAVGRGTTFEILLPRVDEPASVQPPAEGAAAPRGSETILLVEDEPALREITAQQLASMGYTVLSAASGPEASSLATRHAGPLHLLLADVIMPVMSGPELAAELVAGGRDIRILYMSGYTDGRLARHGVLALHTLLLAKPFTSVDLARKVREALDRPDAPTGPGCAPISRATFDRPGRLSTEPGKETAVDFTEALRAHVEWKANLRMLLDGKGGPIDIGTVGRDDVCEVGRWLRDEPNPYAGHPRFVDLREAHTQFHKTAQRVVDAVRCGNRTDAEALLDGPEYCRSSTVLAAILLEMRRWEPSTPAPARRRTCPA